MAKVAVNSTGPPGQPDIAYTPDWEKYQARVERRRASEDLAQTLPDAFPARLDSTLAWDGATVAEHYDYAYHLTEADLGEIDGAVAHFKCKYSTLGKPLGELSQQTFPCKTCMQLCGACPKTFMMGTASRSSVGCQFTNTRARKTSSFTLAWQRMSLSTRGRQDHQFNGKPADVVLAHIKDLSREFDSQSIGSPAYTTEKQVFHTDSGDIIALFALSAAEEGGESYLSSSWTVYNELAATRPDLIRTLAEPWDVDEFGKTGPPGFTRRPLLYHQPATGSDPERLLIQYARRAFVGYWGLPRSANIPAITEAQAEALDALHYTAEKHAVALEFRPGDIQFANNLSIFHARGSFRDSAQNQRHLVRLWLRDDELAWKIPEALKSRWDRVYEGVTAEKQVFPLEPSIRSASSGKPAQPIVQQPAAVAASA
ncbi:hypothetical protein ACCO45_007657 [Purpureocillium lilacinum]|uniref:Uncharacterized protein n=1 Tax=Purpureocillium lilacinum TaxID=33203 RepID=A0ACC4DL86_PURLI